MSDVTLFPHGMYIEIESLRLDLHLKSKQRKPQQQQQKQQQKKTTKYVFIKEEYVFIREERKEKKKKKTPETGVAVRERRLRIVTWVTRGLGRAAT